MTNKNSRTRHGHLTVGVTNRDGGRKIDTWTFRAGDVAGPRDKSTEITFEVAVLHTLEFVVNTKDIPSERWQSLRGKDLSELHAQALEACRFEFDLNNDLTWTDWLQIKIKEVGSHDKRNKLGAAQAFVSYSIIPRGEKPDGSAYTINGNGCIVKFPEPVGVYRGDRGETFGVRRPNPEVEAKIKEEFPDGQYGHRRISALLDAQDNRDADTQFAYLPDTPENRAGLDSIIRAIDDINLRLQQFMAPDTITQTLARAATVGGRLLAAPESPPPAEDAPTHQEPPPSPTRSRRP